MRIQNKMLHDQMASLSATVDKFQSTKASALMGKELSRYCAEYNAGVAGAVGKKHLFYLRKLLRFKQLECAMLEANLASAKVLERERTAVDLANRSIEEARSELKAMREVDKSNDGGYSTFDKEIGGDLCAKLNGAEEQLILLCKNNIMLREESQKVTKKLSEV
jgi:nucleoprotein TPR